MLLVLTVAFSFSTRRAAGPACVFEKMSHNFGEIKEGELPTCEFKFTNTGGAPLKFVAVEKPCGFSKVEYPHTAIAPGETGTIKYEFNSADHVGKFRRTSVIKTNISADPKNDILIMLSGVVAANDGKSARK
ncbi:MAG: DUF1573 domain-containing protein [Bacteroidota bacterium]|nr:DUF1573 domain-containing protein [Bacteroidota bacterium]